eukprot:7274550-Pyramimonas_sp.AAC.1
MRLPLARIGWKMSNCSTLISDFGDEIQPTTVPPALLKSLLRAAVLRQLEREPCAQLRLPCDRVCCGIVRNQLRSKRYSAFGK